MKAGILALCVCAVPQLAHAQTMQWTDKGYVSITGGAQVGSHDLSATSTFALYGEQATVAAKSSITSGGVFDIGGAYRVWGHNLLAGLSFTHEGSTSNVTINAQIPDPIQFGSLRPVTTSIAGAKHSENSVNLDGIWMMPVADKLDVGLFGGPTIFFVKQDIVGAPTVTEPGPTVTAPLGSVSKSAFGINLGADLQYLVWHKVAVGGTARYTWGRVNVGSTLTVGGFQIGAGVRWRF